MKVIETRLPGVLIVEPRVFGDARGFFQETWSRSRYEEAGIEGDFCQDNVSFSCRGTLRGLHYQHPHGQDKLVYVLQGEIFDVAVDIRRGSPTFGRWDGVLLSAENHRQIFVPKGFAHGFCVTSETALVAYKCTDTYHPEAEGGVRWNDPEIGIHWPLTDVLLSEKDGKAPRLRDLPPERLPSYLPRAR
jgi:dTDP-4-dehydrorhamnose 3,5-epimerase